MEDIIRFRHNVMHVNSLAAFGGIRGGVNRNCKDVYFVRLVGVNAGLVSDIRQMDCEMAERMERGENFIYQRVPRLPALGSAAEAACYEASYQKWAAGAREEITGKVLKGNAEYCRLLGCGMRQAVKLCFSDRPQANASMEKNFVVKLLFWHDEVLQGVLERWDARLTGKLVLQNVVRRQEYLFAYLLTLLGYDVLLLQSEADISEQEEAWGLSQKVRLGEFGKPKIPEYDRAAVLASAAGSASPARQAERSGVLSEESGPIIVKLPPRPGAAAASHSVSPAGSPAPRRPVSAARASASGAPVSPRPVSAAGASASGAPVSPRPVSAARASASGAPVSPRPVSAAGASASGAPAASRPVSIARPPASPRPVSAAKPSAGGVRAEKSFEELAQLASSVVQIAIHGQNGDVIGTGSGIMIGRDGYILTNNHVASGGRYYSVRIEDDETVYSTDELIKYHSTLDLAVIRIDRRLAPLPLYKGQKPLVRGQKVVAIGSPLGLFNSVSDGIISGFRVIDGVDMIQFTAPISRGSSGGAVLNMYGEVVGMSTAGIDSGQNINLAMGYECISRFISGFV